MAYVSKDKEDDQNPYGDLVDQAAGGGIAAVPAPQAKKAQSRFVSMDQYFNANKDAANRTVQNSLNTLQSNAEAAKKKIGDTQASLATQANQGVLGGPGNATPTSSGIVQWNSPQTAEGNQQGSLVSLEDAKNNSKAGYAGPTVSTAQQQYAAMYNDVSNAQSNLARAASGDYSALIGQPRLNSFDAGLTSLAAGSQGKALQSRFGDLDNYLNTNEAASEKAINDASTASSQNAKAWGDLAAQGQQQLTDQTNLANTNKQIADTARWDGINSAFWGMRGGTPAVGRPKGEDIAQAFHNLAGVKTGGFGQAYALGANGAPLSDAALARALNSMSDADLQSFMQNINSKGARSGLYKLLAQYGAFT